MLRSYWHPMPTMPSDHIPGKLIVLEGTDGVGRSTQIQMIKNWLESSGVAVFDTGLTRSNLAGRDLQRAKDGHTLDPTTQALYYATDFADRLENEMIPALRAGCVVLTDRYIYTLMARAIVRGNDPQWVRRVYGFAVIPDLILYLTADLEALLPRVLAAGGFDYWESGADYCHGDSRYDCFVQHQSALLEVFKKMVEEYSFVVIDANKPVMDVFSDLRQPISKVVTDLATPAEEAAMPAESLAAMPELPQGDDRPTREMSDIIADLLAALQDE